MTHPEVSSFAFNTHAITVAATHVNWPTETLITISTLDEQTIAINLSEFEQCYQAMRAARKALRHP
jgi:hypothetical protein